MEFEHIIELIDTVSKSNLSTFILEEGNMKLTLGTDNSESMTKNFDFQSKSDLNCLEEEKEIIKNQSVSIVDDYKFYEIKSPLVGIFYTSSSPDADSFVSVGTRVKKGQVIGIIEAMKLMNEIECACDGVIENILVSNESIVEYGQVLFTIKEDA